MFWERNIDAIRVHPDSSRCVSVLEDKRSLAKITLATTTAGDYTLLYQLGETTIALHDADNATEEAREIVKTSIRPGFSKVHIVFGIGLGYLIEQIADISLGTIIVYEPSIDILRFVFTHVNCSDYFQQKRIVLTLTFEDLLSAVRQSVMGEDLVDIAVTRGYATLLAQDIQQLMPAILTTVQERMQEFKTGQFFHIQWIEQFFSQVRFFSSCHLLSYTLDAFKGKPAMIIGRGPSLDLALEDIKNVQQSTLLIAVGSAVRRLFEVGILPDFAVFYDANGVKEQLSGIPESYLQKIHFLINPCVDPAIFQFACQKQIIYFPESLKAFASWLLNEGVEPLDGGGTVSLIALEIALKWGCSPIVLVGQDLAFPGNMVYAGGIPLKRNQAGLMDLTKTDTLYAQPEALAVITGQSGELLPTLKAYLSFVRQFESFAAFNQKQQNPLRLINCSSGGANIQGYQNLSLSAIVAQLAREDRKSSWLSQVEFPRFTLSAGMLTQKLLALLNDVSQACKLLSAVIEIEQPVWQRDKVVYQALLDYFEQHLVLSHFLLFERLSLKKNFVPQPDTLIEEEGNTAAFRQLAVQSLHLLQVKIVSAIKSAIQVCASGLEDADESVKLTDVLKKLC